MSANLDALRAAAQAMEGKEQASDATIATGKGSGHGDPEIKAMLSEVDLLGLIQQDTGETGHERGGRVDFDTCPVCGHRECFRYYPADNSWACFSDSNATGHRGGTALDYFKATRQDNDAEAVRWLREQTGHPYQQDNPKHENEGDGDGLRLPSWEGVRATDPPKRNPVLIEGVLRRGHVGLVAAKGKAGKSWAAVQLSVAVATGGFWFGRQCARGDVLFIDPEIDRKSLDNRFAEVCRAMGVDPSAIDAHVRKWPLRGVANADIENIVHDLRLRCTPGDFALVVIDSASVFVEGDENNATDLRRFASKVLQVADATGGAVLLVHHYGKGNAGDRDAADRARGSSVWLDFPDAALFLTEVFPPTGEVGDYLPEGARAFALECGGIREFPAPDPVRLLFEFPTHRVDAEGVTDDWKPKSSQQAGGRRTGEGNRAKGEARASRCMLALAGEFITRGLGSEGVTAGEAAEIVADRLGETVGLTTLKGYVSASAIFEVEQLSKQRWKVVPKPAPSA